MATRKGYHAITPYLVVPGVERLVAFLKDVVGAEPLMEPMKRQDGSVMHTEVRIGDSTLMMGEPTAEMTPMPAMLYIYVDDVDATYKKALAAGATSFMEPSDQFYGDRTAAVIDPSGNHLHFASEEEDVSSEEMERRLAALKNG